MRCCGVSVSFVVGTTTSESPISSSNRTSKSAEAVVASESNGATTDANYEISTIADVEITTQDSPTTIDSSDTNEFTTENFPESDASTTEPTTENDISITTTDIPNEIVHHDGEIIDNVMIFYPSEMSGKPKAKPDHMPIDTNEFRLHDDAMGVDLHIIFPTNDTVEAQRTNATDKATQKSNDDSITRVTESTTVTTAKAAKEDFVVVTPRTIHPFIRHPSAETPIASSTETMVDLKSEGSEFANQIENVTAKRPRYKRLKLKRKASVPRPSTTTIAPTKSPTPIPAYKLKPRFRHPPAKSEEDVPATTSEVSIVAEATTHNSYLQHLKSLKSRNHLTGVQRRTDSIDSVANEHELKINALHDVLKDTMNATSVRNITRFLNHRRQDEQQRNVIRNMLSVHRAIRPKNLNIASTTTTTTLATTTATEADETTEASTEPKSTTTEAVTSATVISLRERFARRRIPFQGRNRIRNEPITTTTTVATPVVREIPRRRRPIPSTTSNTLDNVVAAESVSAEQNVPIVPDAPRIPDATDIPRAQKVIIRTKIDRVSSSKRKLMETIQRRRPTSTTESSADGPLMEMLHRKRLKTTPRTEETVQTKPTKRYRRRKTTTTTTTTTAEPITEDVAEFTKENQSIDTSTIVPIEITTVSTTRRPTTTTTTTQRSTTVTTQRPTTTTTIISPAVFTQTSVRPTFVEYPSRLNGAIDHPTQSPKDYTEIRRPHVALPAAEQTDVAVFKPAISQLRRAETFPDMHLPQEALQPFNRAPVGARIGPPSTPPYLNPINQPALPSSQSETFSRPLRTLNSQGTFNIVPSSPPFQYPIVPIPNPNSQYYINQNDRFAANRYQYLTPTTFNAVQPQQRPVSHIGPPNPYAGQTAPSPFGNFNLPFNFI